MTTKEKYTVQGGYMLFRRVILMFRKDVEEGYMLKKIMMLLVATNIVASQPPECQPTGTPAACVKSSF